jgi:hypothetical protein
MRYLIPIAALLPIWRRQENLAQGRSACQFKLNQAFPRPKTKFVRGLLQPSTGLAESRGSEKEEFHNAALARWLAPAPSNPIAERLFACRSQDTKRRFRTFTAVAPLRHKCPGSIEAGACLFNHSAMRNNPTQNSCAVLVMLAIN